MDVVEEHKDHHSTQNEEEAPMHFLISAKP